MHKNFILQKPVKKILKCPSVFVCESPEKVDLQEVLKVNLFALEHLAIAVSMLHLT